MATSPFTGLLRRSASRNDRLFVTFVLSRSLSYGSLESASKQTIRLNDPKTQSPQWPNLVNRCGKGQNGNIASPLDCHRHFPLMFCTVSRDSPGDNFTPFRDEIPKDLWILVIDIQFLIRTEAADLPSHERFFLPVGACFFWGSPHSILLVLLSSVLGCSLRSSRTMSRSLPCKSDSSLRGFASAVD